ncbi:venom serine protease Bi-VSP-like [Musca autumnalis]|uniref:venom serine protease Bi-VSP-like n=1 Tax=Musca autumnalis TaxID=221902 RepID=UPI003CFA2BA1
MRVFSGGYVAVLIVLACITVPVLPQRNFRQVNSQYCVTPENFYGQCVALSYCPQIANVFQTTNQRQAQQYIIQSQRACGTRSVNGDPVVCCTNPRTVPQQQQPTTRPNRQTVGPVTQAPTNPFIATQRPSVNPTNPFLNPVTQPITQAPTIRPTPPPTPAPTSAPVIDNKATSCRGPDGREGTCIALINCTPLVQELQVKQTDTVFTNYLRVSNTICGGANTLVCCPQSAAAVTSGPIVRNNDVVPRRLPTVEEGCGYTSNSYKKIVGGEVSKKGAWPWIALIGYDDQLSPSPFKCGGALVTARHVVTAAHCLRKDLKFVRLGEHDLTTDTEARHVDINVVRSEKHPNYNTQNGHSDLAILYLERNVDFTEFISPICMPTTPQLRQKSYVKHTPFVVGWGKTMEGGISANVLQELQIPIYENSVCRDRYQKQKRLFTENQFDSAVLCAGVLSGGKDTCQGDSGGPLMIPEPYQNNVRYYLIGVVSYGIGCARPEIPGVYTSTQYFMDWIQQKIADTQ